MAIVKMKSVMIFGRLENVDKVIKTCYDLGYFHPEDASVLTRDDARYNLLAESNPYQELLTRIEELARNLNHTLRPNAQPVSLNTTEAERILRQISGDLERYRQDFLELNRRIEFCESALNTLDHMGDIDVDLDELFSAKMLQLRFGRMPIDSYHKLNFYREKLFIFIDLDQDEDYCWGICFSVEGKVLETDAVLSSLSFERLWISEELHGTPQEAKQALQQELDDLRQRQHSIQSFLDQGASTYGERLDSAYAHLNTLYETYELRRLSVASKDIFMTVGFIPAEQEADLRTTMAAHPGLTLEIAEAEDLKNLPPPTQLKNNVFLRPMEFFVSLYGLPNYHDIDPTVFLGITYLLLFGIMFGDVGQGLVISLVGWFMAKRGMALGSVMTRLGLSSMLFGFLYGSVFGYEHALDFLYIDILGLHEKPLEVMHPETMTQILIVAVSLGAVLIFLSMLINTFAGFRQKDMSRALFSQNGVPGLVFYGAVLAAVASMFLGGPDLLGNPAFIVVFLVLPLVILFFKEPLAQRFARRHNIETEQHGSFSPVEGFFELFEALLGFTTNTISFLRVGGFVLSHAGMMTVVMLLAELIGGPASLIVVVFGNIFVMVLEGMVCGIQVLRLQFYELFSHYYSGGGKPYRPIGVLQRRNS